MKCIINIFLCFSPILTLGQAISFKAIADTNKVLLGEEVAINYELTYPGTIDPKTVEFPDLSDSLGNNWELRKVNPIKSSSFNDENGDLFMLTSQIITIANFDSGKFELPPKIASIGNDSILSNSLLINVNPVKINNSDDIKDIKKIKEDPFTFWENVLMKLKAFFKWIKEHWLILISILAIICLIIYYFLKVRKKKGTLEVTDEVPVLFKLLSILDEIESSKLWQNGKYKEYFSKIDEVLWEFIAYKYNTPTFEKTSTEILNELKLSSITNEDLNKLQKLFNISDMVKFAKQIPNQEENIFAIEFSRKLIEEEKKLEENKVDEIQQ